MANDHDSAGVPTDAAPRTDERPTALEDRLDAVDRRLTAVEAELDAVRGLLDGVDAVDEAVERRASVALAKVETLESTLQDGERGLVRDRIPETDRTNSPERTDDAGASAPADGDSGSAPGIRDAHPESGGSFQNVRDDSLGDTTTPVSDRVSVSGCTVGESDESRQDAPSDGSLAARLRDAFR
jgi:hypothetical protein